MPNTITVTIGPASSTPKPFASGTAANISAIAREFATAKDGLGLPETATNQEVIDAIAELASKRLHNYIRNWKQNRLIQEATATIGKSNPLD